MDDTHPYSDLQDGMSEDRREANESEMVARCVEYLRRKASE